MVLHVLMCKIITLINNDGNNHKNMQKEGDAKSIFFFCCGLGSAGEASWGRDGLGS